MSSISWTPFVFLRYVFFLILGIVLQIHFPVDITVLLVVNLLACVAFFVLFFILNNHKKYIFKSLFGVVGFLFILTVGSIVTHQKDERNEKIHIANCSEKILWYKGKVINEVQKKAKFFKAEFEIESIKTDRGWRLASGKVIIYQSRNDSLSRFNYGDRILVKGAPTEILPPDNPLDFNFKKYLSYKQIFHQHFLGKYFLIETNKGNPVIAYSLTFREEAIRLFEKFIKGKNEAGMVAALILGVRERVDHEIKNAYSNAGVIHILAVSGMHVALVFKMLMISLGAVKRFKHGNIAFGIISLTIIWLFAFVTGLSASVLRSVVMFTFILIGDVFKQQKNTYNILAISAFTLLIYDPFLIVNIGFQLSFLAVLGIVYLYPRIYSLYDSKILVLDFLWKIIAVSIAAQIATAPLSIYYFHQFPLYFLFANLPIIIIATLILNVGVVLLFLNWIPYVNVLLGWFLNLCVKISNWIVTAIDSLPLAVIRNLELDAFEAFLIYLSILSILALIHFRRIKFLHIAFALMLSFSCYKTAVAIQQRDRKTIVVYKKHKTSVIQLKNSEKLITLSDSVDGGIKIKTYKDLKIFVWAEKTVVIAEKPVSIGSEDISVKETVDLLIIRNQSMKDLDGISKIFNINHLVLDHSNGSKMIEKLKESAALHKIPVHSIPEKGAFIFNF